MKAFHLDRTGSIREHAEIGLLKAHGLAEPAMAETLRAHYPHGLSYHGRAYFTENPLHGQFGIEAIFEYERRLHFPALPSRFESFFAAATLEELMFQWFPRLVPPYENGHVWEIEFEHAYWSGERSDAPMMEIIVKPPLTATRKVRF
ncbi:hypothetical protein I8J29_08105 [Paenibacillus sp. MWE-103]|uniref:Uncharacterized protein n=1 Tax=Paenibacillus artemisiicola TaxID=1172618 RepID=A0ABS3W763_9BACL|nr:hypothetical protein [Paenibacillus artemisiicola]MBO7744152.1 hypothetical protein [Paenibacillus artemisiicola]